jgi:signal transduction histidine kinase
MSLRAFFILVFLFCCSVSYADEYSRLESDSARINALLHTAASVIQSNEDSALELSKKAYQQSLVIGYKAGLAEAARLLGTHEMYQSNYQKASLYYKTAIDYYQEVNDLKKLSKLYSLEGINNGMQIKSAQALDWFLQAVHISEQINDDAAIADLNYKIGIIYGQVEDYGNAITYQYKSLRYAEKTGDKKLLMAAYGNLGMLLGQKKDYAAALEALQKSKVLSLELKNSNISNVYLNLGNIFRETGRYDSSAFYLRQALMQYQQTGFPMGIAGTSNAMADLHLQMRNYDSVIIYAHQSLGLATQFMDYDLMYQNNSFLVRAYTALGRYKEAAKLTGGLLALRDSVEENRNQAIVERTRLGYEIRQKESSIRTLELENEHKTQQRNLLLTGALGSFLFAGLAVFSFLKIRRQNSLLKTQKEDLLELHQVKDKLFSVLSHDLRTPLSGVLGVIPLMEAELLSKQEEREILANLKSSASITLETLDNLLIWGTSQLKQEEPVVGPVDMRELSDKAEELYRNVAARKDVKLVNKIEENTVGLFDQNQMEFILRNLLANAIKFSYANQVVEIKGSRVNGRVVIEVQDQGTGIPEDALEDLFDPTIRKTVKGTSGESGVGLGLTLISDFLKKNNGFISVRSELGRGTCFKIDIPAA